MGLLLIEDEEEKRAYVRVFIATVRWLAQKQVFDEILDVSEADEAVREKLDLIHEAQADLSELLDELPGTDDDDDEEAA
jgi:hypothetical protein